MMIHSSVCVRPSNVCLVAVTGLVLKLVQVLFCIAINFSVLGLCSIVQCCSAWQLVCSGCTLYRLELACDDDRHPLIQAVIVVVGRQK